VNLNEVIEEITARAQLVEETGDLSLSQELFDIVHLLNEID
jgi:hypothetical protein